MNVATLKSIPLFAGLEANDLENLARWADEVEVPEGKHLVDEGRFAYEFFVILDGTAAVVHDGRELRTLGTHDFFGEMGLLQGQPRSATVVARTPMRLGVIFAREFAQMGREMPALQARIREAIEERSQELLSRPD